MATVALVVSVVAVAISYVACRYAARSADAAEGVYRDSTSCRVIAEVDVERGKNYPRLKVLGKGHAYDISYALIAEYAGGGEDLPVEGERTFLCPGAVSALPEIAAGNCQDIRGDITWEDGDHKRWRACRSKGSKWSWGPDEEK